MQGICILLLATLSSTKAQGFWDSSFFFGDDFGGISNSRTWGNWRSWSACDKTCDRGVQTRTRSCINGSGGDCTDRETRSCFTVARCTTWFSQQGRPLSRETSWNTWSNWMSCSVQCGQGTQIRRRSCRKFENCFGRDEEQRPCYEDSGCLRPEWENWSDWSPCSERCGRGIQIRNRSCNERGNCIGLNEERRYCYETHSCAGFRTTTNAPPTTSPINWGPWSECSTTCGIGEERRTTICARCPNQPTQIRPCSMHRCPDPEWSTWGEWSKCTVSCGGGVRRSVRNCSGGENACRGPRTKTTQCNLRSCRPAPRWSNWQRWSKCSVTCGEGLRTRQRICRGIAKSSCIGSSSETRPCKTTKCPGGWGEWENWMECSASCGNGIRLRKRSCTDKSGNCLGKRTNWSPCSVTDCNEDSNWNGWGVWTKCTVTCGGGIRRRKRTCKDKNNTCKGQNSNISACNVEKCQAVKTVSRWNKWEKWSKCDKTCGNGLRTRKRSCRGEEGSCIGSNTETKECKLRNCPFYCSLVEQPDNGKMIGRRARYRVGNKVRFECSSGFTLSGTKSITCQRTGIWTNTVPTCTENKPVECKDIKSLPNGFVTKTKTIPVVVSFECENGFVLRGPQNITCNRNGEWSKYQPTCLAKSCFKTNQFLENSRKCRKSCDRKSECRGISRDCVCDDVCGKSCFDPEKILCPIPEPPENGFVQYDDRRYGYEALYTCQPGYSLSGPEERVCRSDGKWSGNKTRCLKFDVCGQAGNIGSMFSNSAVGARVLAGNSAKEGAWPWQAMVILNKDNDVSKSLPLLKGGGSIVNHEWILTAAHIFDDVIAQKKTNADGHLIILGITMVSVGNKYSVSKHSRIFETAQLLIHPKYKYLTENFDYDVALVRVGKQFGVKNGMLFADDRLTSGQIPFSLHIRPICIPCAKGVGKVVDLSIRKQFSDDVCGRKTSKSEQVAVTGFGTTSSIWGVGATVLQQGVLEIADGKICKDAISEIRKIWKTKVYTSRMLCAVSGKRNAIVDACYGDSGGPLARRITTHDGTEYWIQVGIVSWGFGCGETYDDEDKQYPGFFTKVSSILPFVVKTMKENSS